MNIREEIDRRFKLQEEFLGTDKIINKVQPLVSVTVMTYQHAPFIRECLEGILMQKTSFPYEIIIGEDGSTDGTREICIDYAQKHPDKIRLFLRDREISHLRIGKSSKMLNGSFNRLSTRGKYRALCEGDDYWIDSFKLQKQIDVLERYPDCSITFHKTKYLYEDGSEKYPEILNKELYTLDDLLEKNFIATVSCVFRNNLFIDFPEWVHYLPFGDWVLHILNAQHGNIRFINQTMATYRIHGGGIWSNTWSNPTPEKTIKLYESRIKLYHYLLNLLNPNYTVCIKRHLKTNYYRLLNIYINNKSELLLRWDVLNFCIKNNLFDESFSNRRIIRGFHIFISQQIRLVVKN